MSVRKVVTRRGGHSRGLTPSSKNQIASAWESQPEQGLALIMELSPLVSRFCVQPTREEIVVDGVSTTYVPDLEVQFVDGSIAYFEVKTAVKCRTKRVAARLATIRRHFRETGRPFHLITDEWIFHEPRRSNSLQLMYHRRPLLLTSQERMRLSRAASVARPKTIDELVGVVGRESAWLMLGLSIIGIDLEKPLNGESEIFLTGGHRHATFFA